MPAQRKNGRELYYSGFDGHSTPCRSFLVRAGSAPGNRLRDSFDDPGESSALAVPQDWELLVAK